MLQIRSRFEKANSVVVNRASREGRRADEMAGRAETMIDVVNTRWHHDGFGVVAMWSVTLKNNAQFVTFYDIEYRTEYSAASGTVTSSNQGTILNVLKPGQTRSFEVNDGFINTQAHSASFEITGARKRID